MLSQVELRFSTKLMHHLGLVGKKNDISCFYRENRMVTRVKEIHEDETKREPKMEKGR